MARRAYKNIDTEVFRVVIEYNGNVTVFGPYSTLGAAKSLLTLKLNELSRWRTSGAILEGRVERSTTTWGQVFPV